MLNCHLETMSALCQNFGGQIEQFIGDAIVAFFPDQQPEDSKKNAIKAATAMYQAHQELLYKRTEAGQFVYSFGIGIEYGQIVAGALITPNRSEFCIIGKAKVDAEHYEQLSKIGLHTRIVVSAGFSDAARLCSFSCQPLADTTLFELVAGDLRP
jgi:class 3 adenylate cyclase